MGPLVQSCEVFTDFFWTGYGRHQAAYSDAAVRGRSVDVQKETNLMAAYKKFLVNTPREYEDIFGDICARAFRDQVARIDLGISRI